MRSIIAIAAAAVVACLAAMPGAAAPPSHISMPPFSFSYTDSSTCGFPVDFATTVEIVRTTFYDNTGTPVRTLTINRAEGTMTAATGRTLNYDQAMNVIDDLSTNVRTAAGETSRLSGDGGVVLHAVGRVIWQFNGPDPPALLFSAGQSPQGFDQATYSSTICNYLADG